MYKPESVKKEIERKIEIRYREGSDWRDLPEDHKELIEQAIDASSRAYAPYSDFKVGAAMRAEGGDIITGCNQENAAYPMCNCAEQVTIQKAFSENPDVKPQLFAVYVSGGREPRPAAPCGACRQVLLEAAERSQQDFPILLVGSNDAYVLLTTLKDLLPLSFGPGDLK